MSPQSSPESDRNPGAPDEAVRLQALHDQAIEVLHHNVRGPFITPSDELYGAKGNNWGYLWDTAFAVQAITKFDPPLARHLFDNYMAAQHDNGMVPHMIMWSSGFPTGYLATNVNWHGGRNRRYDLEGRLVKTSPITQPPMLAIAAAAIMDTLTDQHERQTFARASFPKLAAYHGWLYREREINHDGLVITVHPHETGRDDAPSHRALLGQVPNSLPQRLWLSTPVRHIFDHSRIDGDKDPAERSDTDMVMRAAALAMFHVPPKLSGRRVHPTYPYQHFDPGFNAILDRANDELQRIGEVAGIEPTPDLVAAMARTATGLSSLWSPSEQAFRGIDARGRVVLPAGREIGDLLPLYSSHIRPEHASSILDCLEDENRFGGRHLPSVNRQSAHYDADRFWQGADWPQIRLLIMDGLRRLDTKRSHNLARQLAQSALSRAMQSGALPEYHDSSSGEPKGASRFSWAAALILRAETISLL